MSSYPTQGLYSPLSYAAIGGAGLGGAYNPYSQNYAIGVLQQLGLPLAALLANPQLAQALGGWGGLLGSPAPNQQAGAGSAPASGSAATRSGPPPAAQPQQQAAALQEAPTDPAMLELQALSGFMQEAAANSIRIVFDYLEKNSQQFSQLGQLAPSVSQAVELFRTKNYSQAFTQAYQVYRVLTLLRAAVPELPSLQPA